MDYSNAKPWPGMYMLSTYQHDFNEESYLQKSTYQHDYNPPRYMQRSTYKHDYAKGGINNRNRPFPQNVAAPADINPPSEFYRAPARLDPNDPFRPRDLEGYEYEQRGRPERKRPLKRGEEWIPGRRYENYDAPMTDRGDYRIQERNVFDEERGRNGSPDRALYDRGRRRDDDKDRGQSKVKDMNDNTQMVKSENRNKDKNKSLDRKQKKEKEENDNSYSDRDRVRHTSIDRYYDQGRDFSPQRQAPQRQYDRDRDRSMQYHNRYYDRYTNKYIYPDWFERPAPREIDPLADSGRFNDRTTYKDYGEFLEQRIKDEGRRRNEIDLPANPTAAHGGVYLFIRTKAAAFHQIGDALKRNRNILSISGGKLKGIAMPHQIKILEGRHGWNTRAPLARTGDYWSERTDRSGQVEDMILVFQFGSLSDAQSWLRSEPHFKNADFPAPDMADIFISGEKYPDDNEYNTFLTLEIHRCIWREFSDKLAPKLHSIVRRRGAVWEDHLMGMPHKAVHIRGTWVNPHSIFTVIRFRNRGEAIDFCLDSEFEEVQREMRQLISRHLSYNPDVFETTIVLFTLRNMY